VRNSPAVYTDYRDYNLYNKHFNNFISILCFINHKYCGNAHKHHALWTAHSGCAPQLAQVPTTKWRTLPPTSTQSRYPHIEKIYNRARTPDQIFSQTTADQKFGERRLESAPNDTHTIAEGDGVRTKNGFRFSPTCVNANGGKW